MVALRAKISAFAACAIFVSGILMCYAQQPKARLAGLEHNEEYMSLLQNDADLARRIDSLTVAVDALRSRLLREGGNSRSGELLDMESELYMLRGDRSKLAGRINVIEQEWLLANMSAGAPDAEEAERRPAVAGGSQRADLVKNDYFSRSLSRNDYSALCRAQNDEAAVAKLYSRFADVHSELAALRVQYDSVETESAADSLLSLLLDAQSRSTVITDSMTFVWNNVFDNKSYLYDLLFDMEGREDMLSKAEKTSRTMRQSIAKESGRYASDIVLRYCYEKRFIVDYEMDVARFAGLSKAVDSLSGVRKSLDGLKYDLEKVSLRKRCFIDWSPVVFSTRYVYNSKNPVPECPVYEYGVVYRIKLGEYATQQPVAKFKGLEPVSYLRTPSGRWRYYAGCYRTLEELENALKTVKRLGFTKADVAGWNDGVYADNRAEVEELMSKKYSIEISGTDDLPSSVREIVAENEDNTGVTRTGRGVFTVGGLKSRDAAETLANAISAADASLSVVVLELDGAK